MKSIQLFKIIILLTILFAASLIIPAIVLQPYWLFDRWDIGVYHDYAFQIFSGKIPYVDFSIEYPQLALIAIILPYFISLIFRNPQMYTYSHIIICSILYIATAVLVFHITQGLYGRTDRAFIASIMTATAFSATYFVATKYDAYPTFFMFLAVYLYTLETKIKWSYFVSTIGFFIKWIGVLPLPFFLMRDIKQYRRKMKKVANSEESAKNIVFSILLCLFLVALILFPFFFLSLERGNFSNLIYAYTYHLDRNAQTESIFFLLDSAFGIGAFFSRISTFVMLSAMSIVYFMYYKKNDLSLQTLVGYITFAVFIFVFFNKVASPQYILWFTPFFAIILSRKALHIIWFYVIQLWMFLEYPFLFAWGLATNDTYIMWTGSIIFFTLKYILWGSISFVVWKEINSSVAE